MEAEKNDFHVGVQVILRGSGKILLGRRSGIFGHGTWGLPGGRLRQGETLLEAAARELEEEIGIVPTNLKVIAIADATSENNFQLQVGVEVTSWQNEPAIKEPDKCDALEFFEIGALPSLIFVASRQLLDCYSANQTYLPKPLSHAAN